MKMQGNTILITGGGSGIGRALAEAFYRLGNQVVIAGRRKELLEQVIAANPGMGAATVDMSDAGSIQRFADQVRKDYPGLNVVINNAGIMRPEKILDGSLDDAEAIITTNLLGPIRLTAALLSQLMQQPQGAIVNVSSGLAFLPLAATPTYCATKAAIHSYTQSLRYQLKDTSLQVLELVPPYVQTELMGPGQASDPHAMPLKDFIDETMRLFGDTPQSNEICVERVKPLRFAEANGNYVEFFKQFNDQSTSALP
ncbi:SDR family oxidoreductase [Noviherbaspirillum sp. Root189]|uniref:SDR family oxidoreductase n=1 Tax=Noviherbaspirillum sp. Root189 TaxID=1736487 RepID=UPI00070B461F|nr:SDR family oxidoreductase [Noviherbaspirillum sp. Root189]KRB78906.1 oxidoreductase [Noviherbaspirillum sp. Root189]